MSDIIEEFLAEFLAQDTKEDGFATLVDSEGHPYVANLNEKEKARYAETKKPLSKVKTEKKEPDNVIELPKKKPETTGEKGETGKGAEVVSLRGKKLSKEDVNTFYEKQKTLADIKNFFSDNDYELSDYDGVGIWYKNGTYKHYDGESKPIDFKKALKESGIKAVTLESDWGMTYYGKDNEIIMRNSQTDEIKSMADLKKEGIYENDTWVVDDVKTQNLAQDSALDKYLDNVNLF